MTSLTRVELRRFYARLLTRLVWAGLVVLLGLLLVNVAQQVADNTPARVQQRVAEETQACRQGQADARRTDPSADFGCDQISADALRSAQVGFLPTTEEAMREFGPVLVLAAFLSGATFVAAEFTSGSLATWLTFEPRRRRVYASKVAAAATAVLPLAVAVLVLLVLAVYVISARNDLVGSPTGGQGGALAWSSLRVLVLTSAAAAGGAVLGALLRHTAAALGLVLAYFILVEGVFHGLITRLVADPNPWLLQPNVDAWIQNGRSYPIDTPCLAAPGPEGCVPVEHVITGTHAGVYLVVLLAAGVLVAGWAFTRRDVT
jgi:ABC-2 type transport system permease protein